MSTLNNVPPKQSQTSPYLKAARKIEVKYDLRKES